MESLIQVVTLVLMGFAIIWNQQRTTDKVRSDSHRDIAALSDRVTANGERLARIEGHLGIGVPDAARPTAAPQPRDENGSAQS